MRVDNSGAIGNVRNGSKRVEKTRNGEAAFSLDETSEEMTGTSTPNVANVASLDALLSLQTLEDSATGKRRTADRGFDLLDRLEELRLGVLVGRLSASQINNIAVKINALGPTGDRELDAIIRDIDMRARVELAKLGVFDI